MTLRSGAIALLGVLVAGVLAGCGQDSGDPFDLKVGDCLAEAWREGLVERGSTPTVACSEPHQVEIYDAITLPDGPYPDDQALSLKSAECEKTFESFIGRPFAESELDISYVHPTRQSWERGDREILCAVMVPSGTVTTTLRGSVR